jgi:type I restriction enzyme S subunit
MWFYYYFSRDDFYKNLEKIATGTGSKRIQPENFMNLKINLPSDIEEQKAIAQVLSTADKEIELLEKQLELIKLEKKAMMQLLLTGIVRVNEN